MHCNTGGVYIRPQAAFVPKHGLQTGRLTDDREIVAPVVFGKVL